MQLKWLWHMEAIMYDSFCSGELTWFKVLTEVMWLQVQFTARLQFCCHLLIMSLQNPYDFNSSLKNKRWCFCWMEISSFEEHTFIIIIIIKYICYFIDLILIYIFILLHFILLNYIAFFSTHHCPLIVRVCFGWQGCWCRNMACLGKLWRDC